MAYAVSFEKSAESQYLAFDKSVRLRLEKPLKALEREELNPRHLKHGVPFFVKGAGQYRIVFAQLEKQRHVLFVGKHKDYEKWFKTH